MPTRTDYATSLLLELDGESILLAEVSGGGYSAPIVLMGRKKTLAGPDRLRATFRAPLTGRGALPHWVGEFFSAQHQPRAIRLLESGRNNLSDLTLDLPKAQIREVGLSPLNAASIEIASVSVVVESESGQLAEDVGQPTRLSPGSRSPRASAFQFELPGLPTHLIEQVGEIRAKSVDGGPVEVLPFEITIREAHIPAWIDWAERFIRHGENSDAHERTGCLSYFPPDLSAPLLRLHLEQVGLSSIVPLWGAGKYRVVLYAERLRLE